MVKFIFLILLTEIGAIGYVKIATSDSNSSMKNQKFMTTGQ